MQPVAPLPTEPWFNAVSHLIGAVLSLLGMVVLVVSAANEHKAWHVVAFTIYGCSMVVLFLASTLHHSVRASSRINHLLRKADHVAIFLLIAGSVTPICLVAVRNVWGLTIMGIVWAWGLVGIGLVIRFANLSRWVTTPMYLGMGWMGILLARPLIASTGSEGGLLLLCGGLFYTVGALMLALEFPNPIPGKFGPHEVWHIQVLLGAICHYLLMYWCVLPLR
ncbi:MAG: PAQR family membrane homeostasis protein TrhA [Candidatus Xenobia bacterium]